MKKSILFLSLVSCVMACCSCQKIMKNLFEAFSTGVTDVTLTIPAVNRTTEEGKAESIPVYINVDSILRVYTRGMVTFNLVNRISVEEVEITINNADATNNVSNFEYGILYFNTYNTQKRDWNFPVIVGRSDIKDIYASNMYMNVEPDSNLKDHLQSSQAVYLFIFKARRPTTKPLECTIRLKLKFE